VYKTLKIMVKAIYQLVGRISSIKRVATSRKSLFFWWILLSKGSIILVDFPQNEKVLLESSMMRFLYRDTPLKN